MSFTLRNLTVFRRYLTVNNIQTSLCHSLKKETTSKSIYKDLGENPSSIFDYIKENKEYLTGQNCLEALQKLSKCCPEFYCESRSEQQKLLVLCNELDKRTKTLNSSQTIEAIQLLFQLGISPESIIFQSLFRNIRNDSHAEEVAIELQKVFDNMKTTDSAKAILISSFSKFMEQKNYLDSIHSLSCILFKALKKKNIDQKLIFATLNKISKYPDEIPVLAAKSIFLSLVRSPEIVVSSFRDLVKKMQGILENESSKLEFRDIYQILDCLVVARRANTLSEELYNKDFIDSLITSISSHATIGLEEGIEILIQLRYLGHFQKSLIDNVALKCFEHPKLISRLDRLQLLDFVSGLSVSTYKPPFWESIQQLIVENKRLETSSEYVMIRILCNLAVLDCYPHHFISTVFQLNEEQCDKAKLGTKSRFRMLYQLVKTLDPSYPGPWPSQSVLNITFDLKSYHHNMYYQTNILLSTLEKALGGSQYIKSNMRTKLGHFIDHVIVMRKGGFPIAINLEDRKNTDSKKKRIPYSYVEDITAPSESQIIAILCMDSKAYLRNVKLLRGQESACVRSFVALNYIVIPVCLQDWENLNDRDKMPFIMNSIREKTNFLTN